MHINTVWPRPRVYSLYAQKNRRRKWLPLALIPLALAGAWFVVPKYVSANNNDALDSSVQSVAATKAEAATATTLPDTPVTTQEPLADARYIELQALVEGWAKKQSKNQQWSVVVQDIANDANRVAVNDRSTYYMASLYKLFITLPLTQKHPLHTWNTTPVKTDTSVKPLSDCVEVMISKSDNPCGEAIGKMVGWNTAAKAAKSRGMTDTVLTSNDLRSSARDVASYMVGLEKGRWFDEATQQSLLGSLSRQKLRSGIPAGCSGCMVWSKTGDLNGAKHDAAIVQTDSSKFVIVVMSNGGSNGQIADVTRLVASKLK